MQFPGLADTIVAVSTGWEAAPLGVVRLSGGRAFELIDALITATDAADADAPHAGCRDVHLRIQPGLRLPATIYRFAQPNSYTGQDIVEVHTIGNLPLLRALCSRLLELGGRRALPGEFTARAYLNGKLDAGQVDGVLELIHAEDRSAARHGARLTRGHQRNVIAEIEANLLDLLAAIEAGIDFVEEEDVRFVTADETRRQIRVLLSRLDQFRTDCETFAPGAQPHVALAGLPNAGKSTLFNALLGTQRAIVAPVIGTTRDVLSAELVLDGRELVLQDCAGLGASVDDLDAAAHVAAERAADQADLVLWVHDARVAWTSNEIEACHRLATDSRILVLSQQDRAPQREELPPPDLFPETHPVSAVAGTGLAMLRARIARFLDRAHSAGAAVFGGDEIAAVAAPLRRALESISRDRADLETPELVALELRGASDQLSRMSDSPLVEKVLARIFARFCVGK